MIGIIKWLPQITLDPGNNCLKFFMAYALKTLRQHCNVNRWFWAFISSRGEWFRKINKFIFTITFFSRWLGTDQAQPPRSWTPGIKAPIQPTALIYQQSDSSASFSVTIKPYVQDLRHSVHQFFSSLLIPAENCFFNHCPINWELPYCLVELNCNLFHHLAISNIRKNNEHRYTLDGFVSDDGNTRYAKRAYCSLNHSSSQNRGKAIPLERWIFMLRDEMLPIVML